jgi:threonine synthase
MILCSTNDPRNRATFREAVDRGIAEDGGLYVPVSLMPFTPGELAAWKGMSLQETAFAVSRRFLGDEISPAPLRRIVEESMTFPIPLRRLDEDTSVLELFHGPTLAFKDVGARFMARTVAYFHRGDDREVDVLVATSGDTGSAVAQGFHGVKGVRVVLLYPSGKVSKIQEQQMTTIGGNVTALEVQGTFDDCQRLVKQALTDGEVKKHRRLSSANSINIARLMPQMFYYFHAGLQVGVSPVFSVPSGNLGNLTAGVLAHAMGLPVRKFIAACNVNDVLPEYLRHGSFRPRPSVQTIANAMDVGNPSNFARLMAIYGRSREKMAAEIGGFSCTDGQTRETIRAVYRKLGYVLDPHGAIAYRAWKHEQGMRGQGIVIATAHPAKFAEVYDDGMAAGITIPPRLQACLGRQKQSVRISSQFDDFKSFLIHHT